MNAMKNNNICGEKIKTILPEQNNKKENKTQNPNRNQIKTKKPKQPPHKKYGSQGVSRETPAYIKDMFEYII